MTTFFQAQTPLPARFDCIIVARKLHPFLVSLLLINQYKKDYFNVVLLACVYEVLSGGSLFFRVPPDSVDKLASQVRQLVAIHD